MESVVSLVRRAITSPEPDRTLIIVGKGDLQQMSGQANFLKNRGFDVRFCDVYPAMASEEEARRALTTMWNERVDGWWNLRHLFLQYEVCTEEQFLAAIK